VEEAEAPGDGDVEEEAAGDDEMEGGEEAEEEGDPAESAVTAEVEAANAQEEGIKASASEVDRLLRFLAKDPWFKKYHTTEPHHVKQEYAAARKEQKYVVQDFPALGGCVSSTTSLEIPKKMAASSLDFARRHHVHPSVAKQWLKLKKTESLWASMTAHQRALFSTLTRGVDVLHTCRTWDNEAQIMEVLMLHAANHMVKNRLLRHCHAVRLQRARDAQAEGDEEEAEVRDGGFTTANVLLLLPFRNIAFRYVEVLIQILGDVEVTGAEGFAQKFGYGEGEDRRFLKKPEDFRKQFEGNIDDEFCFGITLKSEIVLGCNFYRSDLILASPLMLMREAQKLENGFSDFLSSVELLIVDQADAVLMQNWEWLETLVDKSCRPPRNPKNSASYSRVHPWHLAKCAQFFRQSVVVSRFQDPRFIALLDRSLLNITGRVQIQQVFSVGAIGKVFNGTRSLMQRLRAQSPADASDVHYTFFTEILYPQLTKRVTTIYGRKGLIVLVPSYFDFVRLRNWFEEVDADAFTELCEYTSNKDVSRGAQMFRKGQCNLVLMTERFYFYHRFNLRGARNIIFYRPPLYAHFYNELINSLETGSDTPLCYLFYTRYDLHAMARIVGTERAKQMILAEKDTHMFS